MHQQIPVDENEQKRGYYYHHSAAPLNDSYSTTTSVRYTEEPPISMQKHREAPFTELSSQPISVSPCEMDVGAYPLSRMSSSVMKRMYDQETWRMYNRIETARSHGTCCKGFQQEEQEQQEKKSPCRLEEDNLPSSTIFSLIDSVHEVDFMRRDDNDWALSYEEDEIKVNHENEDDDGIIFDLDL